MITTSEKALRIILTDETLLQDELNIEYLHNNESVHSCNMSNTT